MEVWDSSRIPKMVVRQASPTVKHVEARLTLSCHYIYVIFFGPKGHFVMNKYLCYWTWNLVIIYVTIRVIWTSWAHVWRLRSLFLGMGYDSRPPSSDRSTPIIHCYKKVISIIVTLLITQLCLYFASFLARAPRHRSFTYHCRSLSLSSHTHHPSAQRHQRWWISWPSFASRTAYQHVNSYKYKIFWNVTASHGVIN
jgi:hypothetical protein